MGGAVETYCEDDTWRNRIRRQRPAARDVHHPREAALEVARNEARIRGVDHVVRRADGTVAERNRYPRRSEEIPG